ncbi:hypothetical protein BGZ75_006872 [Mortierella antarctica]|nr:hypothetical protein BGZ75_006872 [Mortierella antarctica]
MSVIQRLFPAHLNTLFTSSNPTPRTLFTPQKRMKFVLAATAALISSAAAFQINDVPFIKTLTEPSNSVDSRAPYPFAAYSRCELRVDDARPSLTAVQKIAGSDFECHQRNNKNGTFCTVKSTVTNMSSTKFALVTVQLCAKYKGALQLSQES